MNTHTRCCVLTLLTAFVTLPGTAADSSNERELLDVVRGFYGWVLGHGEAVKRLEPRIREERRTHRLSLDLSTLPRFTTGFMRSGFFAEGFRDALSRYYSTQQHKLDAMSGQEFAQLAKDGRGPMMETEDMDLFFCAQEYEYKPAFVQQLRVKSAMLSGNEATAIVQSPLGWETTFHFTKADGQWRISAYCVYQ